MRGYSTYAGTTSGIRALPYCCLVAHTRARPATAQPLLDPANPRQLLALDALYNPEHRRRDGRGVGLGYTYSCTSLPLGAGSGRSHKETVGWLHRLPHDSYEIATQGVEVHLVTQLGREGFRVFLASYLRLFA